MPRFLFLCFIPPLCVMPTHYKLTGRLVVRDGRGRTQRTEGAAHIASDASSAKVMSPNAVLRLRRAEAACRQRESGSGGADRGAATMRPRQAERAPTARHEHVISRCRMRGHEQAKCKLRIASAQETAWCARHGRPRRGGRAIGAQGQVASAGDSDVAAPHGTERKRLRSRPYLAFFDPTAIGFAKQAEHQGTACFSRNVGLIDLAADADELGRSRCCVRGQAGS